MSCERTFRSCSSPVIAKGKRMRARSEPESSEILDKPLRAGDLRAALGRAFAAAP